VGESSEVPHEPDDLECGFYVEAVVDASTAVMDRDARAVDGCTAVVDSSAVPAVAVG
jgi:hypothetical protein